MGGGAIAFPNANHAAFATVVVLAAGTAVSAIAAAQVATTVATVAYLVLAITLGGLNIASISAWMKKDAVTVSDYFHNFKGEIGAAIAGTYSAVAQIMLQAVIQGAAGGYANRMFHKTSGRSP